MPAIRVHFVLLPGSLILDWAGPAEVLRAANQSLQAQGREALFGLHFVGPQPETTSSVGARIGQIAPLPSLAADLAGEPGCDWVVLVGHPGHSVDVDNTPARALLHWLRGLRPRAGRLELLCVCAGALYAAHAGLLANRQATTHHEHLDELRAADPTCQVQANRVFVLDPPVASSAGVTTGIDLFLHMVATHAGAAIAAQVAQALVVALRRGPADPELSPFLHHRNHLHAAVHRVQDAISQQPQQDWTVPAMARVAHTSERHLARLFAEHAGVSPLAYLQGIRLTVAEAALASGHNVSQAALFAGFSSDAQLRRTWHRLGRPGRPGLAAG